MWGLNNRIGLHKSLCIRVYVGFKGFVQGPPQLVFRNIITQGLGIGTVCQTLYCRV